MYWYDASGCFFVLFGGNQWYCAGNETGFIERESECRCVRGTGGNLYY